MCHVITGDGNIHAVIMIRSNDIEEVQKARNLSSKMALLAISLGGTCTGEHGIGTGKKNLLKIEMVMVHKYNHYDEFINVCREKVQ